jgi:hypothetical protein
MAGLCDPDQLPDVEVCQRHFHIVQLTMALRRRRGLVDPFQSISASAMQTCSPLSLLLYMRSRPTFNYPQLDAAFGVRLCTVQSRDRLRHY